MKMLSDAEINQLGKSIQPHALELTQKCKDIVQRKPDNPFGLSEASLSKITELSLDAMLPKSFSQRTVRLLSKETGSTFESTERIHQLVFRELYLEKRTSMDCAPEEGYDYSLDGIFGEKLTIFELELCKLAEFKGNILHNLEFEINNKTIQIDILFITQKGIFVIESKNYSGSISGAEYSSRWELRTNRKSYQFYNPILQNQSHINTINQKIRCSRFFSLIAFSERCKLEYIDIHRPDVFVFNRHALKDVINDVFTNEPNILSEQEVEAITAQLFCFCADNSATNPRFKENRSYFSSYSKAESFNIAPMPPSSINCNDYYSNDDDCDYDDYDDDY